MKKSYCLCLFIIVLTTTHGFAHGITNTLQVVGWNVESGGSDPVIIGERIADFENCDIWGLSEVENDSAAMIFQDAAAEGESAEFATVLGTTGFEDRLLIIYNKTRLKKLTHFELHHINPSFRVRSPLVAKFYDRYTQTTFFFMVNHLYRSNAIQRHEQARLLNEWAAQQTYPVVAVGDYNFDWDIDTSMHDAGYDLFTANQVFDWVQPDVLVQTQASPYYNAVLDFVFVSEAGQDWYAVSEIIVEAGDFPDDYTTSDHRPVLARLEITSSVALLPSSLRFHQLDPYLHIFLPLKSFSGQ